MSRTTRKNFRGPNNNYPSPFWVPKSLVNEIYLPGGEWIEPCAGEGNIISAINEIRKDISWSAVEIREECLDSLKKLCPLSDIFIADFLTLSLDFSGKRFDVAITNPPFNLSMEIIKRCFDIADWVVINQRLNFLGSLKRFEFFKANMPDVYVLPRRPKYNPDRNGTDATEYCWLVWPPERKRRKGNCMVLNPNKGERNGK
jgi:hypothetical protein